MYVFIIFLKLLFTCILHAKAAVYVTAASIQKLNFEIKNKKFLFKHDYI